MSLRHLKARLKRLERAQTIAQNDSDPGCTFVIDPVLARALRDDYEREQDLLYQLDVSRDKTGIREEKSRLRASIEERARAIVCPASYGLEQRKIDWDLLEKMSKRRHWGTWLGPPMTAVEDAEEAQARARILAFEESPIGLR
jgi:hypothetical protein